MVSVLLVLGAVSAFSATSGAPDDTIDVAPQGSLLEVEDLDGDGSAEIIVNSVTWANLAAFDVRDRGQSQLSIYELVAGDITPKAIYGPPQGGTPFGIAIGDFDNFDSGKDIVVVEKEQNGICFQISVLASDSWSAASLITRPNAICAQGNKVPTAIAAGNFFGAETDDVVIAYATPGVGTLTTPNIAVCSVVGDGFNCPLELIFDVTSDAVDVFDPIYALAVGDVGRVSADGNLHFAQDGHEDIVAVTKQGRVLILYYYDVVDDDNDPTFVQNEIIQVTKNSRDVIIADVESDGDNDIIVVNADDDVAVVYRQQNNVAFNAGWVKVMNTDDFPAGVTSGDVNSDGLVDVIISSGKENYLEIFLQDLEDGLPRTSSFRIGSAKADTFGIGYGDINNDGFGDLASVTFDTSILSVFLQESLSGIPLLDTQVQVIPRLSSVSSPVYAYNVSHDYFPCTLTKTGGDVKACSEVLLFRGDCSDSKYTLTLNGATGFGTKGQYKLRLFPGEDQVDQLIKVGGIDVNVSIDSNRLVTVKTTKDILGDDGWVKYTLFRKNGCGLVGIDSNNLTQTVEESRKLFHTTFVDPGCDSPSCDYVVEILAQSAGDTGGAIGEFSYSPTLKGVDINVVSNKNSYLVGETAIIRATVVGLDGAIVEYSVNAPDGASGSTGTLSYVEDNLWYEGSLSLTTEGVYDVDVTVSDPVENWRQTIVPLAFSVSAPSPVLVSPQNVDFGTLGDEDEKNKLITITNNGDNLVTGLSVSIPSSLAQNGLSYSLNNTSVPVNETINLVLKLDIPSSSSDGNHSGYVSITGVGMSSESVSVDFTIYNELTKVQLNQTQTGTSVAVLDPSSWSIGTVTPTADGSKTIIPSLQGGVPAAYKVNIQVEGAAAQYITADKNVLTDITSGAGVSLSFRAPSQVGDYSGNVVFEFVNKADSTVLEIKKVPVSFSVQAQENKILKDTKTRLSRAKSDLSTASLKAGAGTGASDEIQSLMAIVEQKIGEAEGHVSEAELAIDRSDAAASEQSMMSANNALSSAEDTLLQISSSLGATSQKSKNSSGGSALMIILLIVGIFAIFGFLVFAFREGWLPISKVPWLKSAFDTVGLGSLVEPAHAMKSDLKFNPTVTPGKKPAPAAPGAGKKPAAPARPVTIRPGVQYKPPARPAGFPSAAKPGAPAAVKPQLPPGTQAPAEKKKPKYTSYYNRRFQQ